MKAKPLQLMVVFHLGYWRVLHRREWDGHVAMLAAEDRFDTKHDSYAHAVKTVRRFVAWRARTDHLIRTKFAKGATVQPLSVVPAVEHSNSTYVWVKDEN